MLKGHLKASLELSGAIRDVMTPKGTRFPRQLTSSQRSLPCDTLKPLPRAEQEVFFLG